MLYCFKTLSLTWKRKIIRIEPCLFEQLINKTGNNKPTKQWNVVSDLYCIMVKMNHWVNKNTFSMYSIPKALGVVFTGNIDHIICFSGTTNLKEFKYMNTTCGMLWLHIVHTESLCYPGKVFTEWFDGLQGFSCGDWFHMTCSLQTLSLGIKCKKMADFGVNSWTLLAPFLYSSKPFNFIYLTKGFIN